MSRVQRHRLIERWAGREWALREHRAEAVESVQAARQSGDTTEAPLFFGQDAGLIDDLPPAGDIVTRIVTEAEQIIRSRQPPPAGD